MASFLKKTIVMSSLVLAGYVSTALAAEGVAPAGQAASSTVTVTEAFAFATKPGQKVGAVYMTVKSTANNKLIKAESDVSNVTEIHTMSMENGIMKMKAIPELAFPAGQVVQLKPGGYHIMLIDLKQPLAVGNVVNLKLYIDGAEKKVIQLSAPVREGHRHNHMEKHDHKHMEKHTQPAQ